MLSGFDGVCLRVSGLHPERVDDDVDDADQEDDDGDDVVDDLCCPGVDVTKLSAAVIDEFLF